MSAIDDATPPTTFEPSPFCAELSSKKRVLAGRPPRDASELLDASRHTWCALTMQAVGPDGGVVHHEDCRAGRSCFRAYGTS